MPIFTFMKFGMMNSFTKVLHFMKFCYEQIVELVSGCFDPNFSTQLTGEHHFSEERKERNKYLTYVS